MVGTIEQGYVQKFATYIQEELHQVGSKLLSTVETGTYQGRLISPVKYLDPVEVEEVSTKMKPRGYQEVTMSQRWFGPKFCQPKNGDIAIDRTDLIKMQDGSSEMITRYGKMLVDAFGQRLDEWIVDAYFGTAQVGDGTSGATLTNVSFDSNQVISVNEGGAASALNIEKIRAAIQLMEENEVNAMDYYMVVSPAQKKALERDIGANMGFDAMRSFQATGTIPLDANLKIVTSNRLPTDGSGYKRVPFYTKDAMHFGFFENASFNLSINPANDKYALNPPTLYGYMAGNATRVHEKKIIEIKCATPA